MKHHKVFRQINIRYTLENAPPEIRMVYENWYYRDGDGLFMKVNVKNNGGKTHFFYAVSADYFHFIDNLRSKKVLGEDAKVLNHESVQPYLESFANGFIEGYHNYNSEIQDSTAIFGKDRDLIAKRVFGQIQKIPHALGSRAGFKGSTAGRSLHVITKKVFFDGGIKTGKLYKAWYFIINNPSLFSPLFRDKYYFWYKGFREYLTVDENIDYRIDLDDLIEEIEKQVPGQPNKQKPESKQPQPATEQDKPQTEAELLTECISQYGFQELEKIRLLPEDNKKKLIEKISESGLPYAIAMFAYLGFIHYLEKNYFTTKDERNKQISKWFKVGDGRAVKGNISSLSDYTNENKDRYTAHKHKKTVATDYEQLI